MRICVYVYMFVANESCFDYAMNIDEYAIKCTRSKAETNNLSANRRDASHFEPNGYGRRASKYSNTIGWFMRRMFAMWLW